MQQTLPKARGASTFAVTTNIERDEATGIPSIVSRLAVAVKRRVLLYSWQDEEFLDGKEILLQGNVRSLTWMNGVKLVAGLNAGFVLVDLADGTTSEIVPPSVPGAAGGAEEAKGWGAMGMSYVGMGGWGSKPLSTKLKGEEIVLIKDCVDAAFSSINHADRYSKYHVYRFIGPTLPNPIPHLVGLPTRRPRLLVSLSDLTTYLQATSRSPQSINSNSHSNDIPCRPSCPPRTCT